MIRLGNKMNQYQNLHNMAASIVDYRQQVNDSQISFSEALLELTDKEIAYQQQESLKRRIKRARFPIIKRLDDFDYQFQPSINQQQIAEFATMSFLGNQENIIFIGMVWVKHIYQLVLVSKHVDKVYEHYLLIVMNWFLDWRQLKRSNT